MPRTIISVLVIFVLVVLGFILLALRSCQGPPEPDPGPSPGYEYPNEETTSAPVIQYPNETTELPPTGGIRL